LFSDVFKTSFRRGTARDAPRFDPNGVAGRLRAAKSPRSRFILRLPAKFRRSQEAKMTFARPIALVLLLALASCATQQPPADYYNPPPRKAPDAKTQLENGGYR
jgi:predicted small lipoprotein YifL